MFMPYLQQQIHDSDPIGNDWVEVTNENFNEFRVTLYNAFRWLRKARLVNHRPISTTWIFKENYPVYN